MSTTLAKPKQRIIRGLRGVPNYITILPPGDIIEEKMSEMGIDAAELARRMEVSVETLEQLIRFEIPLTQEVAEKLEKATQMNAGFMMRIETRYQTSLAFAMEHPEFPAYLGEEIINQPKRKRS